MTEKSNTNNSWELYVKGMHCAACEFLVQEGLEKHADVTKSEASLKFQKVSLQLKEGANSETILTELNDLLKEFGYSLHTEPVKTGKASLKELGIPLLISLTIIGVFVLLQKLGLVNLVTTGEVTFPVVFLIGIIASLSSCMAVVGGLVLSISSSYAKAGVKNNSGKLVAFHVSRLVSFFVLGGLIGLVGSVLTLTVQFTFILNLILFLVMLVLGINLLDIFPEISKFQLRMPKFFTRVITSEKDTNNNLVPILLGTATFFLPCGFTQSMQFYSLTTGNFVTGSLIMLVFALGTLPVLSVVSFASVKLSKGMQSKVFFKSAGFIILFFALFNFLGALTSLGLIKPIFNL